MAETKKTTTTKKTTAAKPKKPSAEVYRQEIEKRAFELYQKRVEGFLPGDPVSDWVQAEEEVKSKYGMK